MKKKVVIIGAGPAGLTAAYTLLNESNNYEITILEASNYIGGISRTVNYKGNRMDIGGHRFFTKDQKVKDLWFSLMPIQGKNSIDDIILKNNKQLENNNVDPENQDNVFLKRRRVSRIYYLKKFFDYPITLNYKTIKNLGFKNVIIVGFSYIKAVIFKKKEDSLENFYINRFGKKLYSMFFKNYTEKLWGRSPKEISASWGKQRVKGISIIEVLKNCFNKNSSHETSLIEEFYYPKYGPGQFYEHMASEIIKKGGQILKNEEVNKINIKNHQIVSVSTNQKDFDCDILISSMPLKDLIKSFPKDVPSDIYHIALNLPYRDFITVGVLLKKINLKNETNIKTINKLIPDCWMYIQDDSVKMGRIQIFNNWSPYLVKNLKDTVWLGIEYFCDETKPFWKQSKQELINFAEQELIKMNIIKKNNILDATCIKVKKAYPAYFDSYKDIDKLIVYLNSFDNLYCIGRNGQHRYNNMDHSMATAMEAVDNILHNRQDKNNIWQVNTEESYHEKTTK